MSINLIQNLQVQRGFVNVSPAIHTQTAVSRYFKIPNPAGKSYLQEILTQSSPFKLSKDLKSDAISHVWSKSIEIID
jgi:hypothetical protein